MNMHEHTNCAKKKHSTEVLNLEHETQWTRLRLYDAKSIFLTRIECVEGNRRGIIYSHLHLFDESIQKSFNISLDKAHCLKTFLSTILNHYYG